MILTPGVGHLARPNQVSFLLASAVFAGTDELLAVHSLNTIFQQILYHCTVST